MSFIVINIIRLYQIFLSPLLGASKCRYYPTCSTYAIEAIQEWGFLKGSWLGIKRIFRCHPFSKHDHFDPIPKKKLVG